MPMGGRDLPWTRVLVVSVLALLAGLATPVIAYSFTMGGSHTGLGNAGWWTAIATAVSALVGLAGAPQRTWLRELWVGVLMLGASLLTFSLLSTLWPAVAQEAEIYVASFAPERVVDPSIRVQTAFQLIGVSIVAANVLAFLLRARTRAAG